MIPRTPQNLADFLGLFLVRNHGAWYGSRNLPQWRGELLGWSMEGAGMEVCIGWHDVLYVGEDKDSLTIPQKEHTESTQQEVQEMWHRAEHYAMHSILMRKT